MKQQFERTARKRDAEEMVSKKFGQQDLEKVRGAHKARNEKMLDDSFTFCDSKFFGRSSLSCTTSEQARVSKEPIGNRKNPQERPIGGHKDTRKLPFPCCPPFPSRTPPCEQTRHSLQSTDQLHAPPSSVEVGTEVKTHSETKKRKPTFSLTASAAACVSDSK